MDCDPVSAAAFPVAKIQRPRRHARTVRRPALEQRLCEGLIGSRLVLLSAPAGCGKTCLLSQAIGRLPADVAVAWVRLDEDDDVPTFAACLAAALEPLDLPW